MDILVRLTCARNLVLYGSPTADQLQSLGSNVYSYVTDKPIEGLYFNNVLQTLTTATNYASLSAGQWCYYGGTLYCKLSSSMSTLPNLLVMRFYIFASDSGVNSNYTPTDTNTTTVFYPPILTSFPELSKSIENVEEGFITTNESNIEMVYTDDFFDIIDDDSFYNEEFLSWKRVNGVVSAFFGCSITNFSHTLFKITFNFANPLRALNGTNTLTDTYTYFNKETFPSMFTGEEKSIKPIPFLFGNCTKYELDIFTLAGVTPYGYYLKPEACLEAVNVNYSSTVAYNTNKTWGTLRIKDGISSIAQINTTIATVNHYANYSKLTIGRDDLFIGGDAFYIYKPSTGLSYYGRLVGVNGYDLYFSPALNAAVDNTCIIYFAEFSVVVSDGTNDYPLRYLIDYTISSVAIADSAFNIACRYYTINLVDYFGNYPPAINTGTTLGDLDPTKHKVYYRFRTLTSEINCGIGDFAKSILHAGGLDNIDTISFGEANQPITGVTFPNVCYTIEEYREIRDYLSDILGISFAFITFRSNNIFYLHYHFDALLISSGYALDDSNIIKGSITYDENCDDVYSTIFYYNNSLPKSDTIGTMDYSGSLPYVKNRIKEIEHYFYGDDIANSIYLIDFLADCNRPSLFPKRTVSLSCFGNITPEVGQTITVYGETYLVTSFTFGKLQNSIIARRFN